MRTTDLDGANCSRCPVIADWNNSTAGARFSGSATQSEFFTTAQRHAYSSHKLCLDMSMLPWYVISCPWYRTVHGQSMDSPWTVHGQSMDSPWTVHGQSMDSPWTVHGQSMDSPWTVHGQSMDSPWTVHGQSMDSPISWTWTVHGQSMDSPWTVHGQSMDCPWTVHGLSKTVHATLLVPVWSTSKKRNSIHAKENSHYIKEKISKNWF